jgi:hypothetical protein
LDRIIHTQSSRWALVLWSKTSKTLFGPWNFSNQSLLAVCILLLHLRSKHHKISISKTIELSLLIMKSVMMKNLLYWIGCLPPLSPLSIYRWYILMCDTTLHNMKGKLFGSCEFVTSLHFNLCLYLRNNSWKPYCVVSFNMGWRIILDQ